MLKKLILFTVLLSVFCVLSAQETQTNAPQKILTVEDAKIFVGRLFDAYKVSNSQKFLAMLPENLKKGFGEQQFAKSRVFLQAQYGTPSSTTFITRLKNTNMLVLLWKVEYKRELPDGKESIQEGILIASFLKNNGVFELNGFRFN